MDPRAFVENLFGMEGETPAQNQFGNEFAGLNQLPIPEDIDDFDVREADPIDLDDVDVDPSVPIDSEQDEEPALNIPDARGKRKGKKQAKCWDHFKLVNTGRVIDGLPETKAVCKYCQQRLAWQKKIGTTHLNRHYKACAAKHGLLERGQTQLQFGTSRDGATTSPLSTWMYSEEEARKGMVKFVAAAELPLAIVDNEHFVNYVKQYLQPRYVGVSRNTLRSNTIEYFLNAKRLLIGDLEKYGGVISLTSDLWEGINKRGYIAATAHYIDPLWVMHKKIIAFKIVEYPHNANTIFNAIMLIIKEYKCESKIRSFTFDNASVNKVVIDKLYRVLQPDFGGYLFHIRCVCHIFNLIVQDGLKHVKDEISRIRNALTYITITPSRKQAFEEFCEQAGNSNTKTFITDVGHRWNSTYLLLKSCEGFEPFITEFYNNRHIRDDDDDILNESDWNTVFKIKKFLESFYTSTNILSGVYYPTSCMVLERLYITARAFNRYQNDPDLHAVIYAMELKFRKYWEELPMLFPLACVMDPRYNLSGTKFIIDQISNALTFNMPITYRNLEQTLTEMYELYASRIGTQITHVPTTPPANINDDDAEVINLLENIDSIRYDSTAYAYGSSSRVVCVPLHVLKLRVVVQMRCHLN